MIGLQELIQMDVITQQEIKLLLDITKDQWPSRRILLKNKSWLTDGDEFYSEALKRKFTEVMEIFLISAEQELQQPLINHINIDDIPISDLLQYDKVHKKRVKRVRSINKYLKRNNDLPSCAQKYSYWFST